MKKSIPAILVIIIIFNLIIPSFMCNSFAADEGEYQGFFDDLNNGKTKVGDDESNEEFSITDNKTTSAGVAGLVSKALVLFPLIINRTMSSVIESISGQSTTFTIQSLVLGKYDLFDINFFNTKDLNNGQTATFNDGLKNAVSTWYYIMRNIALIFSLIVLIYIGIRMAMSTLSADRAKYKQMLISWFTSIVLIFIMQYIIIFMMQIADTALNFVTSFAQSQDFEEDLVADCKNVFTNTTSKGWSLVYGTLMYYVIVYFQLKFFIMYLFRMFEVDFLMIISPLITVVYPIDKVADGRSESFKAWLKEMTVKIFAQVIHAFIYIVFIYSAATIAQKAPLLAMIFFAGLSRGEKVIRNALNMKGRGLTDIKLPRFR